MNENLIQAQYNITKQSKLKKFYENNKNLIFSFLIIVAILSGSLIVYSEKEKSKKLLLSNNYIKAKIYLENEKKTEALNLLIDNIYANDSAYSTLSFFLIMDQNLISDTKEISNLFDHIIKNNNFKDDFKSLVIYKKSLFHSNFASELELIESTKPLLNSNSVWKPQALILLGDYFVEKKEYSKAKDFYTQLLKIEDLEKNLFEYVILRLAKIDNE